MARIASIRHSEQWMTCTKCGDALIAPEWSEYVSKQHVRHFWNCTNCDYQFETSVYLPPDFRSINNIMVMEELFPSLLVA